MAKTRRVGSNPNRHQNIRVEKNSGVINLEDSVKNTNQTESSSIGFEEVAQPQASEVVSTPSEPLLNAEPISIDKAPLLSDEISIMAHAGSAGQPNHGSESADFKVSGDLFGGSKPPIAPIAENVY